MTMKTLSLIKTLYPPRYQDDKAVWEAQKMVENEDPDQFASRAELLKNKLITKGAPGVREVELGKNPGLREFEILEKEKEEKKEAKMHEIKKLKKMGQSEQVKMKLKLLEVEDEKPSVPEQRKVGLKGSLG